MFHTDLFTGVDGNVVKVSGRQSEIHLAYLQDTRRIGREGAEGAHSHSVLREKRRKLLKIIVVGSLTLKGRVRMLSQIKTFEASSVANCRRSSAGRATSAREIEIKWFSLGFS